MKNTIYKLRSPVSAIDARVQLHIGATFFLWHDFFFLARLFFSGATFFLWCDFFFLARLFFSGATFFFWRDFFPLARLCRPLPDLLWAQSTKKCMVEHLVEQDS